MKLTKFIALFIALVMVFAMAAACQTPKPADEGAPKTSAPVTTDTATSDEADPRPDWSEYDRLISECKTTTDLAKRAEMMHQAEDILMDTGALLPIYYYNDSFMMVPDMKGFYANPFGTKFFQQVTLGDKTTLRMNLASEPARLDPALNSSVDGACLAAAAFGGLYTYDANNQTIPNLASGYTMSADGTTYTFTIKDGLKWSDGTPLTAADFEYSWKRAADPYTGADYSYMFNGIAGYDEIATYDGDKLIGSDPDKLQVKADGNTLTVTFTAPCVYALDLMAFPAFFAVPQHAVEAAAGYKDAAGAIIDAGAWALEAGFPCSGPYMLESWTHEESMVYVKNPNYWDAANVKIERIELMLSADDVAIYAAYRAGNLDFIDTVPNDEIQTLLQTNDPEFYTIPTLGVYYVCFNVKSPLFAGKTAEQASAMRRGLGMLVDREYICEAIGQTGQIPATGYVVAGMSDGNGKTFKDAANWTYPDGKDGYLPTTPDIEGAIALLESAGYQFENGMLSAATPISFEYIYNESTGHKAIAEALQQDFAAIGVNMTIRSLDWDTMLAERKAGNYDVARNGWLLDFNDPINLLEMWTTNSGNNDCQFGR